MFLPYHCPTLNGNFFKPPCERQIEVAKEKQEKYPHVMLGFLEKCLGCGGKALMVREGAMSVVKPCHSLPENHQVIAPNEIIPTSNGHEPTLPEKTANYDKKHDKAVGVQEKADKDAILRQSILGAIDIFEVKGVSPTRMMLSEYLGIKVYKIDLLIKELRTRGEIEIVRGSWPNEVQKPVIISSTTNEVAKINTQQEEPVPAVKLTEKEATKMGIVPFPEVRYCPTHPEVQQQMDKLGRWMGMCAECVSIRGRECGFRNSERGLTAPPLSIPLNLPKYAELKVWLEAQAEEGERKLLQQIMFILKMAWKQGT